MDDQECYEWAEIFNAPWDSLKNRMLQRAQTMGAAQEVKKRTLIWFREGKEHCRWLFVNDPSDIQTIRDLFNNDENVNSPTCFVVVKQPDPSDDRGDIIFDIFRLNSDSLLWHFNRVYTPPKKESS